MAQILEILNLLWKNKYAVAGVIILSVILTILFMQHNTISSQKKSISELTIEKAKAEETVAEQNATIINLRSSINDQNNAIENYKKESTNLKSDLDKTAKANTQKDKQISDLLNKVHTDTPVPDDCKGQIDWMRQNALKYFVPKESL